MPLVLNGVVVDEPPPTTRTLFQIYPQFKESASAICSQPPKVVGSVGLLYVTQREFAVTVPHDKNITIIGSEDATTCVLVVLRHTGTGAVGLGHFDGCGLEEGVMNMVRQVQDISHGYQEGRFEVHFYGGFHDTHGISEGIMLRLFHAFHKQPINIELVTACICEMNRTVRGGIPWPIIYGIGCNIKTGEIFPATFPDKGPDISVRAARPFQASDQMLDIYDCNLGLLRVEPLNYKHLRGAVLLLDQTDEFILQHLSTSPEVEPPDFVMKIRAALKHIRDHHSDISLFPGDQPHFFRKDEIGSWILVRY